MFGFQASLYGDLLRTWKFDFVTFLLLLLDAYFSSYWIGFFLTGKRGIQLKTDICPLFLVYKFHLFLLLKYWSIFWKILLSHLVNELVSAQHCLLPHLCLVHKIKLIAFSERHAGSGLNGEFGIWSAFFEKFLNHSIAKLYSKLFLFGFCSVRLVLCCLSQITNKIM